jgi:hypothetical protein
MIHYKSIKLKGKFFENVNLLIFFINYFGYINIIINFIYKYLFPNFISPNFEKILLL